MNQYKMTSSTRNVLFGSIGLGLVCMAMTWFGDDGNHTRFWSNFLHNSLFFTMIAAMGLFFNAAGITAYAGWYTTFKRLWESYSMFIGVGLIFMIILGIGNYFGWHHLYHWTDKAGVETDTVLKGKSSFLNSNWYLFGTIIFGGLWAFLAYRIRQLSIIEDDHGDSSFKQHKSMRVYAAATLPIIGFTSAALLWLWLMSVDAHWYSTLFAWYSTVSAFVAMLAITILMIIFLKANGYYNVVNANHLHDLGKYLFAFSIFWTYLWFSQFMLIWYANIGEETIYFKERYNNYPGLFFINIGLNFLVPFFALMRNDLKRKIGSLAIVSILMLFGHWLDYFLMIKPGVLITAQHAAAHGHEAMEGAGHAVEQTSNFVSGFTMPGLLEIGTFIGFLGLFVYFSLVVLSKAGLVPKHDPYIEESMHHHVI